MMAVLRMRLAEALDRSITGPLWDAGQPSSPQLYDFVPDWIEKYVCADFQIVENSRSAARCHGYRALCAGNACD